MRTIAEHRADVAALVAPVLAAIRSELEAVPTASPVDGLGTGHGYRVLGVDVVAPGPLPRFDNAQMDGFAVRASESGSSVRVVAPIPAGLVPPSLEPGCAAPIMTGARIPDGADAVVPVEDVPPGSFPNALHLPTIVVPPVDAGTYVRPTGSDLRAGDLLARAGDPVTPALLGALAAASVPTVRVVRRPRVLVVSTGSELLEEVGEASIGDANSASLRAALAEVGVSARSIRVPDLPERFLDELGAALREPTDLVVTTGGISMGAFEVVREALEPHGLTVTSVAMQPGGPQAFGTVAVHGASVPVVAFPGNPVSALVSFEVFLRPLFAALAGMPAERPTATLPAAEAAASPAAKHQIRRGEIVDGRVRFVGGASSHLIAHYADATHLVHVPVGVDHVDVGDPLTVWRIR